MLNYSTVGLTNTIMTDNQFFALYVAGSLTRAYLNGVLWYNNLIDSYSPDYGAIAVTNEYTGSPYYLSDGFHIGPLSAAINRGIGTPPQPPDIDGESRDNNGPPDLGADEYDGPPARRVYLPLIGN